ncbi:hypothetical protein SprV_0301337200 [Sparganum proliferum]
MPSSDTSSSSWSESDAEESTSSSSLANDASSVLEGSSLSTDEEFCSTAEGEEVDASPRDSLRKWALRLKIPHAHVNELLKALKPWLPGLPADARMLLGTKYVSAPSTITMSDRPHRQGKPNKKYLCQDYLGDESLPSTPSASDSLSDFDTSNTIPKGQSPERSNARPISSTPKRRRRRCEYSHSGRFERRQTKKSDWTIAGIKKVLLNQREMKAEIAALREEVRRLTASNPLPSASETPTVQQVCTLGGYDELTAEVSDPSYRRSLVAYLSAMGGETVTAFAERIFFTLFSEDVAEFLTFYGRKAGTRGLFESPVVGSPVVLLAYKDVEHVNYLIT